MTLKGNELIDVIIGGDVCPVNRNMPYFARGDAKSMFNDLLQEFEDADLVILNLECPLINDSTPISKNGPVHGVDSSCIKGLKQAGVDVLNLANNHIMDHGIAGLQNTLKTCEDALITTVGAGMDLQSARKIVIFKVKGLRIAILAVAEHEFSIATRNHGGASPLDLVDIIRNIRSVESSYDYLIVLLHGGNEHYPYPSPWLQDTCHFLVEAGADTVVVQHTHCPGCYEQYNGSFIVYGQGNLIFDTNKKAGPDWYRGFLLKLIIGSDGQQSVEIIPYVQSEDEIGARKMAGSEEAKFLKELDEKSSNLGDQDFIKAKWLKYCNEKKGSYLINMMPSILSKRILKKINRYIPFAETLYTDEHSLVLENVILCESHREVIKTVLEERRRNNHDKD